MIYLVFDFRKMTLLEIMNRKDIYRNESIVVVHPSSLSENKNKEK